MTTNNFKVLLKQERIRRGLSQEDLARKIGTTRVTIHRWEKGSTFPTTYFWTRLSKLLGKPIEELFPEISEETPHNLVTPITSLEKSSPASVSTTIDYNSQAVIQEQMPWYRYPISELPLVREQEPLQWEMQRLELIEKRMELQQKQFLYTRDKIETVLEILEPEINLDVRTMVLEAAFLYLERLPFDDNKATILLPSLHWIKETLKTVKQEHTQTYYSRKIANITFGQVEEILEHLQDPRFLGESDFAYIRCVSIQYKQDALSLTEKGIVVREVFIEAFNRLRGSGYRNDVEPSWRAYNILYYRYFKHNLKNYIIATRMEFTSNRQFFRERKKAVEALLNILLEMEVQASDLTLHQINNSEEIQEAKRLGENMIDKSVNQHSATEAM